MVKANLIVLVFCLFVSSVAVVYVRHQHRLEYIRLTAVNAEKQTLRVVAEEKHRLHHDVVFILAS